MSDPSSRQPPRPGGSGATEASARSFADLLRMFDEPRERLRVVEAAFDGLDTGIVVVAADDRIVMANRAAGQALGHSCDELIGREFHDLAHQQDRHLDRALHRELLSGRRERYTIDRRQERKDGTVVWIRLQACLIPAAADGERVYIAFSCTDITELRALEERLAQARAMEALALRAGAIGHDFNNLLTTIVGYSELLLQAHPPGGREREDLQAIHDAGIRAADLARELVAAPRQQRGDHAPEQPPASASGPQTAAGRASAAGAAGAGTGSSMPSAPPRGAERRETLLVVDDDAAICTLIQGALAARGYRVEVATSTEGALERARDMETIDLLLTDVRLPGGSGPEVARQVRSLHPRARVAFMSGYTDGILDSAGAAWRHAPFIQKPLAPAALAQRIRAILDEDGR